PSIVLVISFTTIYSIPASSSISLKSMYFISKLLVKVATVTALFIVFFLMFYSEKMKFKCTNIIVTSKCLITRVNQNTKTFVKATDLDWQQVKSFNKILNLYRFAF